MSEKKSDSWMPFYVGDYLRATARLSPEQHGAYLLLLLDYWTNGPPPNDDVVLAQIARMTPAAWRKARPSLIGFFDIRDGQLIQKRVEHERQRAAEIVEKRVKAGKASAAARGQQTGGTTSTGAATRVEHVLEQTGQQTGRQPQPQEEIHTSSPTTSREAPPEITTANDALNYVCAAADWRPASDTQRQISISIINGWLALGCSLNLILDGIGRARKRDGSPTRSLKRFDSTIRGMRRDQLGGELPVTGDEVRALTDNVTRRMAAR